MSFFLLLLLTYLSQMKILKIEVLRKKSAAYVRYVERSDQFLRSLRWHFSNIFRIYFCVTGYMNPPVLVDINKDGVVDIVCAGFANKIQAFDGETLKPLWTFKMVGTETYS